MTTQSDQDKLCPRGFSLWTAYLNLADRHNSRHPLASAAWDEYITHVRGTSSTKGCPVCIKFGRKNDLQAHR